MKQITHFMYVQAFPLLMAAIVIGVLIAGYYAILHANDEIDKLL